MPPQIVLLVPLGEMPTIDNSLPGIGRPVDPGYGQGRPMPPHVGGGPIVPPPHVGGGPMPPQGPVDPGWGQGTPLPPTVGGGPVLPPGVDNSLPPGVTPPINLPLPPGPPPTVWPPSGSVMPPIAMPPALPDNSLPKPAPGYIVAWVPGYGFTYVKLGVGVGGGPALTPGPKA